MQRLSRILLATAVAAALAAACKQGGEKPKPAAAPPLTLEELAKLVPAAMAGMPRQMIVPTPEINQLSAYFQTAGNTRSGHVTYTILEDPARTRKYYEGRFRERASIGGRAAFTRTWQPKTAPETAEGCLIVADKIGVCVDVAPGAIADLAGLFAELPLAEIEERAR